MVRVRMGISFPLQGQEKFLHLPEPFCTGNFEAADELRGVLILIEAEQSETYVMGLLKMLPEIAMKQDNGPDDPAVHGVAV